MRIVDADEVRALGPVAATRALTEALRGGLDPAAGPARIPVQLHSGQLLLMPAEEPPSTVSGSPASTSAGNGSAGIKIVTVAPGNPELGLPRIQAAYLLFDARTLELRALIDGTALTTLRTPAVSMAAVLPRLPTRPLKVAIIGSGPQAVGHAEALAAHRDLARLAYLVRHSTRSHLPAAAVQAILGGPAAEAAIGEADVLVCATSAREPLFDSSLLRPDAVVIAVGSHEPDAREVDAALMSRAFVIVEDVATALREAGEVTMAVAEGALDPSGLVSMAEVASGQVEIPADRPVVLTSVGMAWEDLVVAQACLTVGSD